MFLRGIWSWITTFSEETIIWSMLSRASCWSSSVLYFSRDIWNRKCVFAAGAYYWDVHSDQIVLYSATFQVDVLSCGHPSLRPILCLDMSMFCFCWQGKRIWAVEAVDWKGFWFCSTFIVIYVIQWFIIMFKSDILYYAHNWKGW